MSWHDILRELREEKGLNQTQLAQILNVKQKTISNWETGRNQPSYEILKQYSQFFNVPIDYILENAIKHTNNSQHSIQNNIVINGDKNRDIGNIKMK